MIRRYSPYKGYTAFDAKTPPFSKNGGVWAI